MLLFGHKFKNIKPKFAFVLPLLAIAAWWGMLTSLLVCWFIQGRPLYVAHQIYFHTFVTFLSNVGATNLQPLFIVGSAVMGIFYVWSLSEEFYLRSNRKGYLLVSFKKSTHVLHWCTIVFAGLASLSILLVSCLKNNKFGTAHGTFVGLFIVFDFFMSVAHVSLYFIYYKRYNKQWFLTSAILKIIWIILALVLVICYLVFHRLGSKDGDDSIYWGYSGIFEWSLCFWFSIVLFLLSIDLYMNKNKDINPDDLDQHEQPLKTEQDLEGFTQDVNTDYTMNMSENASRLNTNDGQQPTVVKSTIHYTRNSGIV